MNDMTTILVGYMGSGKTSVGSLLPLFIGNEFYDLDEVIVNWKNQYIHNFLLKNGENNFRTYEKHILYFFKSIKKGIIISPGGGTPCFRNNIYCLNNLGKTFYFHLSSKEIFKRVVFQKYKRPLISCLYNDKLLFYIQSHLSSRIKFYNKSNYKLRIKNKFTVEIIFHLHNQLLTYYYKYGNIKTYK